MPDAAVFEMDALEVLGNGQFQSVFTSLPDAAEMDWPILHWRGWFEQAVEQTVLSVPRTGYAIFYQTDRRVDGHIESKAALVANGARAAGARVVWHKIAVATTGASLFRPGYTHLIAVSVKGNAGKPTPDVFSKGSKIYRDATDRASIAVGLDFLERAGVEQVADPFCGRGSIAYGAALRGLHSTSIDIDGAQVAAARILLQDVADVSW
jgi:hypothetical protein